MTFAQAAGLVAKLAAGWPPAPHPPVDEFFSTWKERVGPVEILARAENAVSFRTGLPNSCLRGGGSIYGLLLGGLSAGAGRLADDFVRDYAAPGRLLFLFCATDPIFESVRNEVRCDRCLVWSPRLLISAWTATQMVDVCQAFIRSEVPLPMLIPYDITVSASGPMFFGRKGELAKLSQEDGQSFAVTGPGRIGKTSLVKKFQADLLAKRDPAWNSTFYVDFFECSDRSPDMLARKIAMSMEPGRRADRMTAADLSGFIEYQQSRCRRRPTLILDEVDDVCGTSLFREQIAVPARHDHCRFILVGRGGLLRFTKDNSGPLASRLRVQRLGEIDVESAQRLLFFPIRDLGMEFENFERVYDLVQTQTGRSPHMIQFYGQRLVEIASEQSTRTILLKHVDSLKWDYATASFFLSPLGDLKADPRVNVISLALLKVAREFPAISPMTIQDVGRLHGIAISHAEAVEIGDTLVIHNILTWGEGGYRMPNAALPEYAGKMGYLTRGLDEARQALAAASRKAV